MSCVRLKASGATQGFLIPCPPPLKFSAHDGSLGWHGACTSAHVCVGQPVERTITLKSMLSQTFDSAMRLSRYNPCLNGTAYPCLSTVFVPIKPDCHRRVLPLPFTDPFGLPSVLSGTAVLLLRTYRVGRDVIGPTTSTHRQ